MDRRDFIKTSAALSLTAAGYARAAGSNGRLGVAFVGCGARAQAHIDVINRLAADGVPVRPAAVCDVWDGYEGEITTRRGPHAHKRRYRQGLKPSAKRAGLDPADAARVTKDYRRVLGLKDVDIVCIAAPDHWHARMTLDAARAGKDVYCETPGCRTLTELQELREQLPLTGRVVTYGAQTLTRSAWSAAAGLIRSGRLGHVIQGTAGASHNDSRGLFRYYPVLPGMTPRSVDWASFCGDSGAKLAFSPADFAQWRCRRAFSAGVFTHLMLDPLLGLTAAINLGEPASVAASGGQYFERDGRDGPDVVTLIAEYAAGCQLVITATSVSNYPTEQIIRGRRGTLKFSKASMELIHDDPDGGPGLPGRPGQRAESVPAAGPKFQTRATWENFIECLTAGRGVPAGDLSRVGPAVTAALKAEAAVYGG